nr:putative zinc-binding protein [Haloferax sp. Atlit-12N]
MSEEYNDLPLVYLSSGCSSAAQMANDLAVRLDRERLAEMSSITGVSGDVTPLENTAR